MGIAWHVLRRKRGFMIELLERPKSLNGKCAFWTSWSGRTFDILKPDPDAIQLVDIAHHLARTCRWGGGTPGLYSVAEHSLRVGWLVPAEYRLEARIHDAHEFILGDVAAPLKGLLSEYEWLTQQWDLAICDAFGVDYERLTSDAVHEADQMVRLAEEAFILGRVPAGVSILERDTWLAASQHWGLHRIGNVERFSVNHIEAVFLQQLVDDLVEATEKKEGAR